MWGMFIITFSGFCLSVYGSIVTIVQAEWNITSTQAGFIGSSGMVGMMVGSILLSYFADHWGAKRLLMISIAIFSVFIVSATLFESPILFGVCRFMAGVGSGGATPIILSLLTEYAPSASKSKMVAAALCGNQIGGILASVLGILLIDSFGWRTVLWAAGIPILLMPFIYKMLPESAQFLEKNKKYDELEHVLGKIDADYKQKIDVQNAVSDAPKEGEKEEKVSYSRLFNRKYILSTVLLSVIYIMGLLAINGVNTWLPDVMVRSGYSLNAGLTFTIFLNVGTMAGTILWAAVADKKGFTVLLPLIYTIGAICLMAMGVKTNQVILYICVMLIGFFLYAAHSLINAFATQFYPDDIRTTGVGFANSIGRIGGMLGPTVGGMLLSADASIPVWFATFGAPGIIAAVSLIVIQAQRAAQRKNAIRVSNAGNMAVSK